MAALAVVAGALVVGFADGGFGGEASAEPAVQTFLLEWQNAHYAQAAALTTGTAPDVSAQLEAAYTDLDATHESFAMQSVTQHGATAVATFAATVDLAGAGQQWSYTGKFGLTSSNGHWAVNWAPSVINPSLGPGDRLAAATTYAPRAALTDLHGQSLLSKSATYRIGVYPGKLKNAQATADGLAGATGLDGASGLDELQVLGQIQAAPPGAFLSLLTLSPADFSALWPKLSKVPGLSYQKQQDRLFASTAQDVVGSVGTENADALREEGAAYQPGMTVGVTGLEKTYQDSLIGTPTTAVEVVNKAGRRDEAVDLEGRPRGHACADHAGPQAAGCRRQRARGPAELGGDHRGQLSHWRDQRPRDALGRRRGTARWRAGERSRPAGDGVQHRVGGGAAGRGHHRGPPAAVRAGSGRGRRDVHLPARHEFHLDVRGRLRQRLRHRVREHVQDLDPGAARSAERAFGIGSSWQLPMQSFSGTAPSVSGEAQVAAQVTGAGGAPMSPLGMVTVAAESLPAPGARRC